jgi:hypothetical protein
VVANLAAEPRTVGLGAPVLDVVIASADLTVEDRTVTLAAESVAVIRVAG